ncbi:Cell division protein FtsN [Sodalis praecaptivus]
MAQRDYVGRGKSSGTRRKTTNRKKKRSSSGTSKTMIALAAAVLITFIGGLYFIAHNKSEEAVIVPNRGKNAGSGLPPKPEERWRYIKELENRQIGVQSPTEPTAGGKVNSPAQLTDEQRQLLEQMQADMRREPTHLNEVPYNDQSKAPAAGTAQTRPTTQTPRNPFSQQPVQAPRQTPPATVAPQPAQPARQAPAPASQPPRPFSRFRRAPSRMRRKSRQKRSRSAGWSSAVRSKRWTRRSRCVPNWPSPASKAASPPAAAGTASCWAPIPAAPALIKSCRTYAPPEYQIASPLPPGVENPYSRPI